MGNAPTALPRLLGGLAASLVACAVAQAETAPPVASASKAAAEAPANPNLKAPHFDILEYVVDGNTVLEITDVEEAVYPYLGESKTAIDVDKAREALEKLYQAKGYPTVQVLIPGQGVEGGTIHLQVVENPVGRLRVLGSNYHSLAKIKDTAPSLAEGAVVHMPEVQKDIVALNQQSDMKVTPQLKAGKAPGTVDVDLQVEDHLPLHASVEVNNQYTQKTKPLRVVASAGYDNLWQLGHSLNFSYQVAPENPADAEIYSGSYLVPIPRSSLSLLAYGVKSNSNVAALAGTDVIGRGTIFGLRAITTLPGEEGFYHSFTIGLDRKDLAQNVITAKVPSNSPVLYYPVSLAYSATWLDGDDQTQLGASLNFALPGGSDSTKFDAQRFDALRQYFYLKANLSFLRQLIWGFSLFEKLQGQITADPLLSSEQFSVGGANTVRGYLEAERLGDYGAAGTVEIRTPSVAKHISSMIDEWYFLAFFDDAGVWLRDPLPGEASDYYLAGAGLGTRFSAFKFLNGAVDVAFPLINGAVSKKGDARVQFRFWSGL